MKLKLCVAATTAILAIGQAGAGTVTNGTWTPSGCGPEPQPPTIDLSSEGAFGKSLEASDKWEAALEKYYDCADKEGIADSEQARNTFNTIKTGIDNLQPAHQAALDKNQTNIDAGISKYSNKFKKQD